MHREDLIAGVTLDQIRVALLKRAQSTEAIRIGDVYPGLTWFPRDDVDFDDLGVWRTRYHARITRLGPRAFLRGGTLQIVLGAPI